jgi:sensor histidine kinase YesM
MDIHDFVFSEKTPMKLWRHFLFWFLVLFLFVLDSVSAYFISIMGAQYSALQVWEHLDRIVISTHLLTVLLYTYVVFYCVIPLYFVRKKYTLFVTTVVILTIGAQISSMLWEEFQIPITKNQADGKFWKHAIEFLCRGPHVICSLFIALSMLRSGFMKEEEKVMLMIENNSAELQLLKAQIHPHFLFNTLNNIYSFALRRSLHASRLVTKLSAILKYMIYECEAPLVSVEQEVKMLRDYIGLEKVRYTEKLQIEINVEGNFKNKLIAPLLLIPFVEMHSSTAQVKC